MSLPDRLASVNQQRLPVDIARKGLKAAHKSSIQIIASSQMKRPAPWKTPSRKRAAALFFIACGVLFVLGVLRHLDEVLSPHSSEGGEDDRRHGYLVTAISRAGAAIEAQEWRVYDQIHLNGRKAAVDPDIMVLGIDDDSLAVRDTAEPEEIERSHALQLMAGFPWSREVYARILDRLFDAGARTVVIDLLFPTASNSFPEGDAEFADALEKYKGRVVVGADFVTGASGGYERDALSLPWSEFVPQSWPADERVGFVTFWADDDGKIRRARFLHSQTGEPGRALPSFAAAVVRLQGREDLIPEGAGDHLFRFSDARAYLHLPIHEIFIEPLWRQNYGSGAIFKDKTVFVGPAARSMQDFKDTPVGTVLGMQVHAHALGALKSGSLLKMAPLWARLALLVTFVLASWLLVLLLRRAFWCMLVLLAVVALGLVAQLVLFNVASLVVPMTVPMLGWGFTGFIGLTYDYLLERMQKQALRRRISRFHSPDMVAAILADPDDYQRSLAGARRSIAILFSDVRGFTTMSENLPPEEMIAQLTEYLDRMVEVVFKYNGAIDKFIGDAVMAGWGRLRQQQDETFLKKDALDAVATGLEMLEALAGLNASWKARGMEQLHIGIGIHQGEAIVGELGTGKSEFTAIGDTVNSASRLESATKQYGVDLIISDVVRERVKDTFVCRSADLVKVQGKTKPMEVFTVQGRQGACQLAPIEVFEAGIRLFREGNFAAALAEFEKARAAGLDDGLSAVYVERCEMLISEPPEAWDGVWTMTKK